MKNRPWNNHNTDIELTSLLDVIFIILMIVICSQQLSAKQETANAAAARAQAEVRYEEALDMQDEAREAIAENELLHEHIDALREANDAVGIITLYADYMPSDPSSRTLRIFADDRELEQIELHGAATQSAFTKLEETLSGLLLERKDQPVFITIDKTRILYRDEQTLQSVIDRLLDLNTNLYIRSTGGESK